MSPDVKEEAWYECMLIFTQKLCEAGLVPALSKVYGFNCIPDPNQSGMDGQGSLLN